VKEGTISCWGLNKDGQTELPLALKRDLSTVWVSAGPLHSCALNTNSELTCWGDQERINVPARYLTGVRDISSDINTCVITLEDNLDCWGSEFTT